MSASFAMPVAARRVLFAGLFLGGLLALAFVFGGSAQAADQEGQRGSPESAFEVLKPSKESGRSGNGAWSEDAWRDERGAAEMERRLTEGGNEIRDAAGSVVKPVVDGTGRAVEPVTDVAEDTLESAPLPALPGKPGEAEDGQPREPGQDGDGSADGAADRTKERDTIEQRGPYGPRAADTPAPATERGTVSRHADSADVGGDSGPVRHHPAPTTPFGPFGPYGPASSSSAGDGNGPRGGADQHVAHLSGLEHLGLRPGAVRAADRTPTRDRASEILEFPG